MRKKNANLKTHWSITIDPFHRTWMVAFFPKNLDYCSIFENGMEISCYLGYWLWTTHTVLCVEFLFYFPFFMIFCMCAVCNVHASKRWTRFYEFISLHCSLHRIVKNGFWEKVVCIGSLQVIQTIEMGKSDENWTIVLFEKCANNG